MQSPPKAKLVHVAPTPRWAAQVPALQNAPAAHLPAQGIPIAGSAAQREPMQPRPDTQSVSSRHELPLGESGAHVPPQVPCATTHRPLAHSRGSEHALASGTVP